MEIQIIVDKNLVIIDNTSVSIDCSKFKEQFVFCEVNEKENCRKRVQILLIIFQWFDESRSCL